MVCTLTSSWMPGDRNIMSKSQPQIGNGRLASLATALQQRKTGLATANHVPNNAAKHKPPSPTITTNYRPPSPTVTASHEPLSPMVTANGTASRPLDKPPSPPVQRSQSLSVEPKSRHAESPETKPEEDSASSNSQGVSFPRKQLIGPNSGIVPM